MDRKNLQVYFIMGTLNAVQDPLHTLEQALQAGVTMFQLREKGEEALAGEAYIEFAKQCQQLCAAYHVPFIINDDIELAVRLQADGVHIGQDDAQLEDVKKRLPHKLVGVSVHNEQELEQAVSGGADYVGIGPIYKTQSKSDANAPAGTSFLTEARKRYPQLPIVAIGGLTVENAGVVFESGADGAAVISAIASSKNISATVQQLKELAKTMSITK